MKKLYLSIVLIPIALLGQTQELPLQEPTKGKGKILGRVIDSTSKLPVEFATVALWDIGINKPVDGTICEQDGKFAMSKIAAGKYKVAIVFIGYKTKEINNITIEDGRDEVNLGDIQLNSIGQSTQEVTVEGQRATIEEKVDRVVYNAENDETNRGGDATDVLRKAPLITVDLDGNVTLRGNQNVRILINNKPSTISANSIADALKQIPAEQVKSVEVITSPSAKYDAEGSGGIINIILKKNNLEGFFMSVNGSGGVRGSSLGLNGSYKKKKMGFSLGGFGRAGYNIPGEFENKQITSGIDGTKYINVQTANTHTKVMFGQYTLGWDYDLNKNNAINSTVKYSLRDFRINQDNLYTQSYQSDSLISTNTRQVNTADLSHTVDANFTYTHTFDKPKREFSLMALYSRNNRTNDFTNAIMNNADINLINNRLQNKNQSFNQEITVQADYQTPFGEQQLLEIGAKNISRNVSSEYQYLFGLGSDGPYLPSTSGKLNNTFRYNQNVTASYLSHTISFMKSYSIKAGLRYEYTTISADFENALTAKPSIPSYGVLTPSINLSKKTKIGMVKASYNRRIQRPSIQYLNPNVQASNPLNINAGNPSLSPEYTNNYELSFSTYLKGSSISLAAFMRNTTGAIQSVRNVNGDTISTTYRNIGNENAYGFNLFSNINISKKISINGGSDLYYAILKNNDPNPLYSASNQGWVASYRLSGNYEFAKGWGFQLFGFYRARQVQLQGFQSGFGIYSLSLKRDFHDKKGSIGVGAENFFTPNFHIRNELNSPNINQQSVNTIHFMNFKINFSYQIGKMSNSQSRKRRKTIQNDDLKEGGDNSPAGGGSAPPSSGGGGATPTGGSGAKPTTPPTKSTPNK